MRVQEISGKDVYKHAVLKRGPNSVIQSRGVEGKKNVKNTKKLEKARMGGGCRGVQGV